MPIFHILGNVAILLLAAAAGWSLSRRRWTALLGIGLSGVSCAAAVALAVRPDLILWLVAYSDLTFYSNLYPATIALFVPCAFRFIKTRNQRTRMVVMCGLLFVLSFKPYEYHFRTQAHSAATFIDDDGVCRQTSDVTCSAASLVTYLRLFGKAITEEDAIELARTKSGYGTTSLGLYRALSIMTGDALEPGGRGRDDDPKATVRHLTAGRFLERDTPAIILVGLPQYDRSGASAAFGRNNNWPIGIYHDVVFMGADPDHDDRVLIADPDMGLESWPIEHFQFLFRGVAVMYE
jgi:hypothetical protein